MCRVRREQLLVTFLGRGEGMVASAPRLRVLVVLEHREVYHPQRLPSGFGHAAVVTDARAQRTEAVVDDLLAIGTEEDEVPCFCAGTFQDAAQEIGRQEFHDR